MEPRRILPKGTSPHELAACKLAVVCPHVNSYGRLAPGWASPMDLAEAIFPEGLLDACGIEPIDPKEASLTPFPVSHAIAQL